LRKYRRRFTTSIKNASISNGISKIAADATDNGDDNDDDDDDDDGYSEDKIEDGEDFDEATCYELIADLARNEWDAKVDSARSLPEEGDYSITRCSPRQSGARTSNSDKEKRCTLSVGFAANIIESPAKS